MKRSSLDRLLSRLVRFFFLFAMAGLLGGCLGKRLDSSPEQPALATTSPTATLPSEAAQASLELELELEGDLVKARLPWKTARLWRSYSPILGGPRESLKTIEIVEGRGSDDKVPHGVILFYRATGPEGQSLSGSIEVPNHPLPDLVAPELEVDKANYSLEVWDRGSCQKRYPIALGADPKHRKYCQDMASTPEGWYEIYNLQADATYHKALDVDYPRPIDHVRHRLAIEKRIIESTRPIGGEIQIHGWGIQRNWTAGCMALRNEDMDEIFANSAIQVGIPVFIAGSQLRPEDKGWLRAPSPEAVKRVQEKLLGEGYYLGSVDGSLGDETALSLGRYQLDQGLPMTGQLDSSTRKHFGI